MYPSRCSRSLRQYVRYHSISQSMDAPRYMGVPTFMRAPLTPSHLLTPENKPDIALIGVPFDGGVTNRPGARHGPREVRNQTSLCRGIHEEFRFSPHDICKVHEVGDVPIKNVFDIPQAHQDIRQFYSKIKELNIMPLSIGGDHSITAPLLDGLIDDKVGLIHIDAHCDVWDAVWGSDSHHGTPFKLLNDWGKLDNKRVVQIGIRGAQNIHDGWDYSQDAGFRVIFMHEFIKRHVEDIIAEVRDIVGDGKVYLSFDIDGICPSYAPGTGTPEFGGITPREAIQLIRGLRGLNFVGGDLVEVAPCFDQSGNTALLGAHFMYEMLCILSENATNINLNN